MSNLNIVDREKDIKPEDLPEVKTYEAYEQGRFDEKRDLKDKLINLIEEL